MRASIPNARRGKGSGVAESLAEADGSLTERAHALIKADIVNCDLAPATTISTVRLIERYGLGTMPVRSAMERLIAEHWVESLPQRGYRIAPITVREVVELYDLAEQVSPRLARLSAGRIADRHDELVALNALSNPDRPPRNRQEEIEILVSGSEILHQIRQASGNRYAIALTQQIAERLDRVLRARALFAASPLDCRRNFEPLIEALFRNDAEAAEAASLATVRAMRALVLTEILSIPDIAGSMIHSIPDVADDRRGQRRNRRPK